MKNRLKKRLFYRRLHAFKENRSWMNDEEYLWEYMVPVGREFGSPDYERFAALDALAEEVRSAAGRAATSIDETIQFVNESNARIGKMNMRI